jgi:teichuronic acid biosynthesis glycosyltransferase TuaG
MLTSTPLVSIVTPCFNGARHLEETAESIFSQTYKNIEWIIVDDASVDNSWDKIKELKLQYPYIVMHRFDVNKGAAESRNKAIELARGDYVAFLDADDLWTPDKLQMQVDFMQQTGSSFSYHSFATFNSEQPERESLRVAPKTMTAQKLLFTNPIGCLTVMLKTSTAKAFKMTPGYFAKEDYIFWYDILKTGVVAQRVPGIMAKYRLHPENSSSKKAKIAQIQWDVYRKKFGFNRALSFFYFVSYALFGVFKTYSHFLRKK